jgi:ATP-dependent DNA helicase RecQ
MERYGALELTEKSRPLLRGETQLQARKQLKPEPGKKQPQKSSAKSELRSIDEPIFQALRELRTKLAEQQGVPPYVIFADSALTEMSRLRPLSEDAFRYINGVGEIKLERYGKAFMEVIRDYPLPELLDNNFSETINETLSLHLEGLDADAIAKKRNLANSTIYGHLAEAISAGMMTAREALTIDEADILAIEQAAELLNSKELGAIKPLHEELEEAWDYGILKCVVGGM